MLLNHCYCELFIFLIMKANEMHYFLNLFDKVLTCFGQVHCPSSGVSEHCIHAICICHASSVGCLLAWSPDEMHYFLNLFDKVLTCFGQVHCPSSGVSEHCIHAICICHASSVGCLLAWSPDHASRQPTELAWQIHIACIQCSDTSDDGQWTCPKHVSTLSNKFKK